MIMNGTIFKSESLAAQLRQHKEDFLAQVPAIIATVGDMKSFRSGREFAAFLGLVPRQSGTGGKVRLLGISKRGDSYLRKLLTHGARAVVNRQIKNRNPWIVKQNATLH
ncbi:hypothetical protein A6M27_05715 [Acidithiobacillus thiooxidans]|jgi:transposase|uniref:Transposase IS116/IS110/IS902 C-terminal domain-containing protein n=1 Tax=Acidithiobacillus thiooxidans TaxID=930 RepID=A0A1C2JKR7_ACITH|nr:hypothetical protein A6P07_05610 [Acidithiobacillus thiooxidans]OCX77443.1 hypothetical protein A6O24_06710 [Acidithiobacillus thiooxidans]OCX85220.1 hypothetical protein A6O26_01895 [Acidithiobacillus thiooxidans]OCX88786.1 hypothetical protein A6M27_05715 [Acidithiobacillus thiooxidans]OFC42948.1 hypothetical protein BAE47_13985 [Acidithiobacillus thiooxidans]